MRSPGRIGPGILRTRPRSDGRTPARPCDFSTSSGLPVDDIDVVVSDIGLPDGSGLDLMRRIKARRDVPGIALSGFGRDDDLQNRRAAGFVAHLTKPVDFARLEATIQRVATAG